MKKILVTGATGFIGKQIIQKLISDEYRDQVTVIATSSKNETGLNSVGKNNVQYLSFDLRDYNSTTNYFDFFHRPDVMIHLAWEGLPNYKEAFHLDENFPRHYSFLKNLIENGLKDLTVTGTCLEYGKKEGALSEDSIINPETPYAIAKNKLRLAMEDLKKDFDFSFKWVRLFYMWGPGQNPNSLLSQLDKALANNEAVFNMSGGEQVRDYLPVQKVAEYIIKIALQKNVGGIINCCSGNPVSIKQFVKDYLTAKNRTIKLNLGYFPYTDYEPMSFWGDVKKLKTILDNE